MNAVEAWLPGSGLAHPKGCGSRDHTLTTCENAASQAGCENPRPGKEGHVRSQASVGARADHSSAHQKLVREVPGADQPFALMPHTLPLPPPGLKGNMSPRLFDPRWPQSGISDPVYKEGCEMSQELCGLQPVEDKDGPPLNTSWPPEDLRLCLGWAGLERRRRPEPPPPLAAGGRLTSNVTCFPPWAAADGPALTHLP